MKFLRVFFITYIVSQINLSALSFGEALSSSIECSTSDVIIISATTVNPNFIKYSYSDGSEVQLYPKSIMAFERFGMAIQVDWSHRSADNEWWHHLRIGGLKFELFIHNRSVDAFFPNDATIDHIDLIEAWVAGFPGFGHSVVQYHSGVLIEQ